MRKRRQFIPLACGLILIVSVPNLYAYAPRREAPSAAEPSTEAELSEDEGPRPEPAEGPPPDAPAIEVMDLPREEGRIRGPFTLDDCIRLALERNLRLRGAGLEVEAARGQLAEAKAGFWPVLEYTYRMAPVPTDVNDAFNRFFDGQLTLFNSLHVGIGVPVTAFGQLRTVKRLAEGGLEAAGANELKARGGAILQVKQLYWGILLGKEMIKLLDDASHRIREKVEEEEAREEKELDPYDVGQLKLTGLEIERRLDEARVNLELALEGMRLQMDLEPGAEVTLSAAHLRPAAASLNDEASYVDAAIESHPDSQLLDIGLEVKRNQYRLEKFKLAPQAGVGFFVDLGRTTGFVRGITATGDYNDPFNYTRAGVGLQFKGQIDFHGAYGRIRKARAEYYKASFDRLFARRALGIDTKRAYEQVARAKEDVKRAEEAQAVARQMMFLSKINLDMGIGDAQKYGDALKAVLFTRGVYFKAVYDYNVAEAELAQRVSVARYDELTGRAGSAEGLLDDDEGFDSPAGRGDGARRGSERGLGWEPRSQANTRGDGDADGIE